MHGIPNAWDVRVGKVLINQGINRGILFLDKAQLQDYFDGYEDPWKQQRCTADDLRLEVSNKPLVNLGGFWKRSSSHVSAAPWQMNSAGFCWFFIPIHGCWSKKPYFLLVNSPTPHFCW